MGYWLILHAFFPSVSWVKYRNLLTKKHEYYHKKLFIGNTQIDLFKQDNNKLILDECEFGPVLGTADVDDIYKSISLNCGILFLK